MSAGIEQQNTLGPRGSSSQQSGFLSNLPSWDSIVQSGLLNRILVTLGLFAFYRLGVQVPLS
ncbi:MAG TPA: hypothetical protein V6C96_00970, partial [Vampirovibrionales bacterium]